MEDFLNIAGWVCIVAGIFSMFTGAVGIWRMPDFFARLHPAGINDSAGLTLVLLGILLHAEFGFVTGKIILLILFSMITSATACHALARAAIHSGMKPQAKILTRKRKKNV